MDRAYLNRELGRVFCCWQAPSRADIEALFEKAGAPFEEIIEVEEALTSSF
ncbi:DUF4242 domain-containing protein [Candidatus Fermentibacterales bacterium]|nr:DUF4242 domain-containing protein [Candidatus Fermentibacterales bacterium]